MEKNNNLNNKESQVEPKDQAEYLCQMYKTHFERFKHTRDVWFKITLTLWTFIILAAYSIKKEIHISCCKQYLWFGLIYLVIGFLIWFFYYHIYRRLLHNSQVRDKGIGIQYRNSLNEIIGVTLTPKEDEEDLTVPYPKEEKWEPAEGLITLFLYLCAGLYLLL